MWLVQDNDCGASESNGDNRIFCRSDMGCKGGKSQNGSEGSVH